MPVRSPNSKFAFVALCLAAVVLSACGGGTAAPSGATPTTVPSTGRSAPITSSPVSAPPNSQRHLWLVEDFTLALLERNGLPASTITRIFDTPRTLLIVRRHGSIPDSLVPQATKVQSFASLTTMEAAIQNGTIEPGVKYLLYDNEAWAFTPVNERQAPINFAAQAAALAHAHGFKLIFTPAANLAPILSSAYTTSNQLGTGTDKYSGYLNLDLAGKGAAVSDIFEIQGQQAEVSPSFPAFVHQATTQARAAAPANPVLLGITTAVPGGGGVSAAQLSNVVAETGSVVDGYWLNVPQASAQCPACGAAHVAAVVSFLEAYAAGPGG